MRFGPALLVLAALAATPSTALADPARNEIVARRVLDELLGQGRFDIIGELYDPAFVFHGEDRDYSVTEVEANMRMLRAAFPDLRVRIERAAASGDLVSVHWSGTGTNSVRVGGFPGGGRRVAFSGMAFVRLRDGRMVEEWAVQDSLALLRQLGLLPRTDRTQGSSG
jgi:predicted ester cyclase